MCQDIRLDTFYSAITLDLYYLHMTTFEKRGSSGFQQRKDIKVLYRVIVEFISHHISLILGSFVIIKQGIKESK